jgi:4-hydroxybenzoyl-CoA thioesterase
VVENTMTRRVEFGDTDAAGVVFYPNYFRWFDQATHELLRSISYPASRMFKEGFIIPLVETHAEFLSPVFYDDLISISSRIAEVRTRAFRVQHQIRKGEELVCDGYEVRMWVRTAPGEELVPEPIPDSLRRALSSQRTSNRPLIKERQIKKKVRPTTKD